MTTDEAIELATEDQAATRERLRFAIEDHQEPGEPFTQAAKRYALDVLYRDERTVRRWLAGESPIPKAVARVLLDD